MGQRSQIYIRYKNKEGVQLIARYYGWNYGERMVSRTRSIIEWLSARMNYREWFFDNPINIRTLERICDVNFDMRDLVSSTCIKEEIREQFTEEVEQAGLTAYLFGQPNNDGQLLIDVIGDKIKYALIPCYTEAGHVMDAAAYMEWDFDRDWHEVLTIGNPDALEYTQKNFQYISSSFYAELMTPEEAREFVSYDYTGAVFGYPF